MVVAAPAAAVVESAGAIRGPDPLIAAHPPRSRRRMWVYIGSAVAAILLILLIGTGAYLIVNRPVTFDVSRTTASPGDSLVVTASHLPQNQVGEIQLNSVLQRYPFHADGNGNLRGTIFLPSDLELGEHTLRLCWNGTCHRSVTLHIVGSGVALTSPTSAQYGSPSPTSASTPTAGSSPSPTHNPSPSPTCNRSVNLGSVSLTKGTNLTLSCFTNVTVTIYLHYQDPVLKTWQIRTLVSGFTVPSTPFTHTWNTPLTPLPSPAVNDPADVTVAGLTSNPVLVRAA